MAILDFLRSLQQPPNAWGISPFQQAQMMAESGGNPNALSPKGAAGLMQIMPDTARQPGYGVQPLQGWDGKDPRTASPEEQLRFGRDYQAAMEKKFGSPEAGLAAYNAGPGRMEAVNAGRAAMPAETQKYVTDVMARLAKAPKLQNEAPGFAGKYLKERFGQGQDMQPIAQFASNGLVAPEGQAGLPIEENPQAPNRQELWKYLGRLGTGMAAASGPSRMPVTFAQVLAGGNEYADKGAQQDAEMQIKRDLLDVKKTTGGASGGTTMAVFNMLRQQYPDADPMTLLRIAQNKVGTDMTVDMNTQTVNPMTGAPVARGALKGAEQDAKNQSDLDFASRIKQAEGVGKVSADRQENYTKAQSALQSFTQQSNLVTKAIDDAMNSISGWSTGYGAYLSALPNTDARKLDGYLNTIKSNIGFDKLQSMRENSPTGGALGQVSDMENKLLQAVNGALDPMQKDILVQNLQSIKELYPQVLAEKQRAFMQDYGAFSPVGGNKQPFNGQSEAQQLPPSPAPKYNEGQTATNPKTGERLIFKNGKWGPM